MARPGELLEAVPGLIVTQHSGEGKANQYFLRGFNLDHGTDLAISLDGMPLNMRTHGHGQGYADVNFLIPELVQSLLVRKGPYFAEEGDFSSAGAAHIRYRDRLDPGLAQITYGSFGYFRALAAKSFQIGAGDLLVAFEGTAYNGPWSVPDDIRKLNSVVRYSQGTQENGFSLTAMAYANRWNATDQVAARAIASGFIDRFGSLDPTDGGATSRFSLSGQWGQTDATSATRIEAYAVRSALQLFNNFTYFLDDPVRGDQFTQIDRRTVLGVNASHAFRMRLGPFDSETRIGLQGRFDAIDLALRRTEARETLSTVREDRVQEGSLGAYVQNTTWWTTWLRTVAGLREDVFAGRVTSDTAANSGATQASLASPKASVILGPFNGTEFYVSAGTGFHSNDLRGVTITVDPNDKVTPLARVPLLVRTRAAEIGMRTKAVPGLESTVALFLLDQDSELLFVGDAGTTEASRPSRRIGVEWTNVYRPLPWLRLEGEIAYARARFTDFDPAGSSIPGAPALVASAGLYLGESTGWFAGAKLRYFGPRPLTEDASVRSRDTLLANARLGYVFENGVRLQLDGFNIFNSNAQQIAYYYVSRLPGEPAAGVADQHIHPVEPRAFRLTLAGRF